MSDTYGSDLSKRGYPGRLLPEQREAHARLSSLPTWGRRAEPVNEVAKRQEASQKARTTMLLRGSAPPPQKLPAMIVQAREVAKAKAAARLPSAGPKQRKKRTRFVILNARPNKWGFAKLEPLEVISGKYQGQRGQYVGAANSRDAYVRIDGVDRAIRTEQLRRVAG
jgi:hypothetical protein